MYHLQTNQAQTYQTPPYDPSAPNTSFEQMKEKEEARQAQLRQEAMTYAQAAAKSPEQAAYESMEPSDVWHDDDNNSSYRRTMSQWIDKGISL